MKKIAWFLIAVMLLASMPVFAIDAKGRICKVTYHVKNIGEKYFIVGRPNAEDFPYYADGTHDMELVEHNLFDYYYTQTGVDEILTIAWYKPDGSLGDPLPLKNTQFSKYAGYIPFETKKNAAAGSNVTGSMDGTVYEVVKDANGNIISRTPVEPGSVGTTPTPWAVEAVTALKAWGKLDPSFFSDYQGKISRQDFAWLSVVLYETLSGKGAPSVTEAERAAFTDSQNEQVLKAYGLGLVNGYGNGKYGPADPVTREQIAKLLVGACEKGGMGLTAAGSSEYTFKDQGRISSWALPFVRTAYKNGIMKGTAELTISPASNTTREQALQLVYNILKKAGKI